VKKKKKKNKKYSFKTIETHLPEEYCHYSGLPSPAAYENKEDTNEE
jgi:hypothetical protein